MARFPKTKDELLESDLFNMWWYYGVELLDGVITTGVNPTDMVLLPRKLLSRIDIEGKTCLDVGTMEGLIPTLLCRRGAKKVVATDSARPHTTKPGQAEPNEVISHKVDALRHYYNANFEYVITPEKLPLSEALGKQSFDVINCSGLLYLVFSPIHWLAGVRPLLRTGGLMVVSTNMIFEDSFSMHFNHAGSLQPDPHTFWYMTPNCLDYLLRSLRLAPIDCVHVRYDNKKLGYMSVVCRATDDVIATQDDSWMRLSVEDSWEYIWYAKWDLLSAKGENPVVYRGEIDKEYYRNDTETMDLWIAAQQSSPITFLGHKEHTSVLRLSDLF